MTEREYMEALLTSGTLRFTKRFYRKRFNRRYIVAKHHRIIADALDRVLRGECTRLMINIFPRSGKTEIAVKNFIALGLAVNPASKFIHLTYSNDLALDNSEEIRDEFVRNEEYQRIFPYVQISKSSTAKNKWFTTAGGGVYAAAAGGAITGFGAGSVDDITDEELDEVIARDLRDRELADFISSISGEAGFNGAIIIDDPLKPDDAFSETIRERVNRRWLNTIKNRLNSIRTPVVVIGQRLHPHDFCGHILKIEGEEWTVINIPALYYENDEPKSIWETKMPAKELLRLKEQDSYTFESQYQQNPTMPEGLLFPEENLTFVDMADYSHEEPLFRFATVDPADTGGDYFTTALLDVVRYGENDLRVLLRDVVFTKSGLEAACAMTREKFSQNHTEVAYLEINGLGRAAHILLESAQGTTIAPYVAHENKMVRILSKHEFIQKSYLFKRPSDQSTQYRDFMRNLTGLLKEGKNANDDSGDSLAASAEVVQSRFGDLIYGMVW